MVELLLVLAAIAVLSAGGIALDRSLASGRAARTAGDMVVTALREAGVRAAAMTGDDAWSVHIASASVTVYRGTSFAGRTEADDRTSVFPVPIVPAGPEDVMFTKGGGVAEAASLSFRSDRELWYVRMTDDGMISHGPH